MYKAGIVFGRMVIILCLVLAIVVAVSILEIGIEGVRISASYNVPYIDGMATAISHWQNRLERRSREINEWLEELKNSSKKYVEYPMVNKYISWEIMNKK